MLLSTYFETVHKGSQADFARAISAFPSDLSAWIAGTKPVPSHFCAAIEKATDGRVTRRELRPDDWHRWWPELAAKPRKVPA